MTRTITTPRVLWQADVGVQGWLNNPIVANGLVIVGSAGNTQFEHDDQDGVIALDLGTGEEEWFFDADLDVNGVAYADGVVVATGDEGRVWGLAITDGRALWTDELAVAAFGNPLIIGGMAIVGDGNGNLTSYDLGNGVRRWSASVSGPIRGGAASDGETIFFVGEDREAAAIALDGTMLWRQRLVGRGPSADSVRVFAAPTVVGDLLIIGLVREAEFAEPAIMALDKATGSVVWRATDVAGIKSDWGNVRSSPAALGDFLVYGEPYSRHLVGIELETGETQWAVETGAFWDFCEWQPNSGYSVLSSPAIAPNGAVIVGTLEGVLIAIGDEAW
jgi:outer membrane protein assembly factor BamB